MAVKSVSFTEAGQGLFRLILKFTMNETQINSDSGLHSMDGKLSTVNRYSADPNNLGTPQILAGIGVVTELQMDWIWSMDKSRDMIHFTWYNRRQDEGKSYKRKETATNAKWCIKFYEDLKREVKDRKVVLSIKTQQYLRNGSGQSKSYY